MKKVKKKTTNNDNKERLSFIFGAILFGISIYLCFAFVSYFSTGAADQTLIEEPRDGEVLNEHHEFENTCGSLGAYAAWFFIKRCFGLPAFLIPLLLFVVAIHLMKAYRVNLLKWTLSVALLMIWASVALATFLQPLFADASFSPGGDHGMFISNFIGNLVGAPGLTAILALIAVAFLTYFSAATVIFIRKMLNPTLYINKVKFTVNRPGEAEPENYEPEEEEKPLVFDDPATQTVEFKDNGEAVVIDEGYQNEDNNIKPGFLSSLRKKKEPEVKPEETEKAADSDIDMAIEVAKGDTETADKKTLVEDIENMEPYDPKRDLENYHYPTLDLLKKYDNDGKPYIDMAEQTANKNRIVDVLRTFGV
jgi:S-DNA-T family DNA segregation ATPase FtsK/SpoIIIE